MLFRSAVGIAVPAQYDTSLSGGETSTYSITIRGDEDTREFDFFVQSPFGLDVEPFGVTVNPNREYRKTYSIGQYADRTVSFDLTGKVEGDYKVLYGIIHGDDDSFFKESATNVFNIRVRSDAEEDPDDGLDIEVPAPEDDDDSGDDSSSSSSSSGGGGGGGGGSGGSYIYSEDAGESVPDEAEVQEVQPSGSSNNDGSGDVRIQDTTPQGSSFNEMAADTSTPKSIAVSGNAIKNVIQEVKEGRIVLLFLMALLVAATVVNLAVIKQEIGRAHV